MSASQYPTLDQLVRRGLPSTPDTEQLATRLSFEARTIRKKMSVLPTAREMEAMPELAYLVELSRTLLTDAFREVEPQLVAAERLEKLIFEEVFAGVAGDFLKTRIYTNKSLITAGDGLLANLVEFSSARLGDLRPAVVSLLNTVADKNQEFYKNNGREASVATWAFGECVESDTGNAKFVEGLKRGDLVDCIKSIANKQLWSRAVFDSTDASFTKVRFLGESSHTFILNKNFDIRPFGTKSLDYEWREGLQAGDLVDYFNFKTGWVLARVVNAYLEEYTHEEPVKMLEIRREGAVEPAKPTAYTSSSYDELTSTIKLKAHNPVVAKPGSHSTKNASQVDDSQDAFYLGQEKKPKYAILRPNSTTAAASVYFVRYINQFGAAGGFDFVFSALTGALSTNGDAFAEAVFLIKNFAENLVQPFIQEHGDKLLTALLTFANANIERNIRSFSQGYLSNLIDAVSVLSLRLKSFREANAINLGLMISVGVICLKSEILEKQFFGAKLVLGFEFGLRDQSVEHLKARLADELLREGILEMIVKGHPSLIAKSAGILKVLIQDDKMRPEHLDLIWSQIGKADSESRTALISLVKDISGDLSRDQVRHFLLTMSQNLDEISLETIDLLQTLRRTGYNRYDDAELNALVNQVLWGMLQSPRDLKPDVAKELNKLFVRSVRYEQLDHFLPLMVANFVAGVNKSRNLKLLTKYLKEPSVSFGTVTGHVQPQMIDGCVQELINRIEFLARQRNAAVSSAAKPAAGDGKPASDSQAEARGEVKRLLRFLTMFVFPKVSIEHELFTFDHFERLFDAMFQNGFVERQVQNFVTGYLRQPRHEDFAAKSKRFFTAHLQSLDDAECQDFLPLFLTLFHAINLSENRLAERFVRFEALYSQNRVPPKEYLVCVENAATFFGIDALWGLFRKTERKWLFSELAKAFVTLYLPGEYNEGENEMVYTDMKAALLDTATKLFAEGTALAAQKASLLLQGLVRREEAQESPAVTSLAQLREGESITVFVEKDTKYMKDRFKVKMYENETLFALKQHVAAEYKLSVERVILLKEDGSKISGFDNFQTLELMNIGDNHNLLVREADVPEASEVLLTNKEGTDFSPKVLQVFREIFEDHSENGLMNQENFAWMTQKATGGVYCSPHEERVLKVFRRFDRNNTGFLDLDAFVAFYRECAFDSPEKLKIVKQNLQALGYKKDFRLKRPLATSSTDRISTSTRHRLANDPHFFANCLRLLNEPGAYPGKPNHETDFIGRLFSLLPPPLRLVEAALADPLEFVHKAEDLFMLSYRVSILNGLFLRADFLTYVQAAGLEVTQQKQADFVSGLISPKLLRVLCERMEALGGHPENAESQAGFLPAVQLLSKVFRAVVSAGHPEFIDTVNKLGGYNSYKSKPTDKPAEKEKPAEKATTTATTEYGPKEKDAPKTVERESENREAQEQATVAKMLEHFDRTSDLLALFDFPALNATILKLLNSLNREIDMAPKDLRILVRLAVGLLAMSGRLRPAGLAPLVDGDLFADTFVRGLSHSLYSWRMFYTNLYALLSLQFKDPKTKTRFLKILISNLRAHGKDEYSGLVELACFILAEIGELKARNADFAHYIHTEFNFLTLFQDFQEQFLAHPSKEFLFGDVEDQLLGSYLAFLENILNADDAVLSQMSLESKQQLVHHVFHECLFQVNDGEIDFSRVKCHSRKTRALAFALLRRLLRDGLRPNIHFMVRHLSQLARHIPHLVAGTAVQSEFDKKFANGFLGIRNLGCVCYMIATLQQFYCTPAFRYGILMASDGVAPELTEVKGQKLDDNFFHQFQRMLAYLDYSERKDFSPLLFCLASKDYSGQPMNVLVQQDADEFLKILADKIENALKKSPFLGILRSVFLGRVCNVIRCKGCGYVKTNEEDFFNLSLEVKGTRNIHESLDKLVEPEIISDYTCDSCKNKVDISKRALLQSLPNVMFLSLKKMYFDLELLTNVKIHSRYEFPSTLNLRKYMHVPEAAKADDPDADATTAHTTATDAPDEDFEYKLVGVVIHKGNAEYGHYISLVNANRGDPVRRDIRTDKWFEFDDSRVTWFDMRKFDEECFGANEDKEFSTLMSSEQTTSNSAYLLVYDKVRKNDLVFSFGEDQAAERRLLLDNLIDPADLRVSGNEVRTGFYNLKPYVPEPYRSEILRDNKLLTIEQHLLSKAFTNAMADIFTNVAYLTPAADAVPPTDPKTVAEQRVYAETILQVVPQLISHVYCVASDSDRFMDVVGAVKAALTYLSALGKADPSKKEQIDFRIFSFFKEQIVGMWTAIIGAITGTSDVHVSNGLTEYIVGVTGIVIAHFGLSEVALHPAEDTSCAAKIGNLVYQTVLNVGLQVTQVDTGSANIRKSAKLFVIAARLAEQLPCVLHFFAIHGLLHGMMELYLKVECGRMNPAERTLAPILRLISDLYCYIAGHPTGHPSFAGLLTRVPKVDIVLKALKEDYKFEDFDGLKRVVFFFFAEDKTGTEVLVNQTLTLMTGLSEGEILGCLEAFRALLMIRDSMHSYRIQLILGEPRLLEGNTYSKDRSRGLLYGLSRELSLKKPVYQYVSPFGLEKGLLDQIVSFKETHEHFVMMLIHYLLDFMLTFDGVFHAMVGQRPHNYLSGTFFDWFSVYIEHHLKYDTTSYSTYKSEAFTKKLTEIPEKITTLMTKLRDAALQPSIGDRKVFATGSNPYVGYVNYYGSDKEPQDNKEMWSPLPNFIIGKTVGYRVLKTASLVGTPEEEGLEAVFTLVRVALLPSRPTGQSNLAVPANSLLSDLSINTYTILNKDFSDFLGLKKGGHNDYEADRMDIEPILQEEETDVGGKGGQTDPQQAYVKLAEPSAFQDTDYILRISLQNSTNNNYQVQIWVQSPDESAFSSSLLTVQVRLNKRDFLVHTLCLKDPRKSFAGIRVTARWREVSTTGFRNSHDDYPSPYRLIFAWDQH